MTIPVAVSSILERRIYLWYSLPLTAGPLGRHHKWNKSENLPFANGLKPAGLRVRIRTIFLAKLEFSFQSVVTRDRIFSYTWMLRLYDCQGVQSGCAYCVYIYVGILVQAKADVAHFRHR